MNFIGVFIFVSGVVLMAVAIFFQTATPAPLSAAKSFIGQIETERFDPAYSKYHGDLRQQQSFPEFKEVWSSRSPSLREANRSWSTDAEDASAVVTGRFTTAGKPGWSVVFRLIKQVETWQIVGYEITDEPPGSGP